MTLLTAIRISYQLIVNCNGIPYTHTATLQTNDVLGPPSADWVAGGRSQSAGIRIRNFHTDNKVANSNGGSNESRYAYCRDGEGR